MRRTGAEKATGMEFKFWVLLFLGGPCFNNLLFSKHSV